MHILYVFAGALATMGAAQSSAVGVSPVRIDQPGADRTAIVTVRNRGAAAATIQVRLFRWTQVNGEDKLVRTNEVIASPPATIIQPGRQNLVRIVRIGQSLPANEEAYRLLVDEIPDRKSQKNGTVQLAIRHSIPVFFRGADPGQADLAWRVERKGDVARLKVTNSGRRHARLSRLVLSGPTGQLWAHEGLLGYVLPGSAMGWTLPKLPERNLGELIVTLRTQLGEVTVPVPVEN